jgi:hypothetical protein
MRWGNGRVIRHRLWNEIISEQEFTTISSSDSSHCTPGSSSNNNNKQHQTALMHVESLDEVQKAFSSLQCQTGEHVRQLEGSIEEGQRSCVHNLKKCTSCPSSSDELEKVNATLASAVATLEEKELSDMTWENAVQSDWSVNHT